MAADESGSASTTILPRGCELRSTPARSRFTMCSTVLHIVNRDLAGVLRSSQPRGKIVVLADPDSSAAIAYYGGLQSVGTLYWENTAGLKAAAEIFCAEHDEEARRLIRARGITHVVQ